jgi:hypothetical protein
MADASPLRTGASLQFKSPLMAFDTKKALPQRPSSSHASGAEAGGAASGVVGGRRARGSAGDVESKVRGGHEVQARGRSECHLPIYSPWRAAHCRC